MMSWKPDKKDLPSLLLTVISVAVWCMGKPTAESMAVSAAAPLCCLTYHFAHANIFHLLCNMLGLWPFHPRWLTVAVGYLCSTLAALLLALIYPGYGPVCGLSALIFACFARRYAVWHFPIWKIVLFNVPFIFIPRVDGLLHLLSFFISYLVWLPLGRRLSMRHP